MRGGRIHAPRSDSCHDRRDGNDRYFRLVGVPRGQGDVFVAHGVSTNSALLDHAERR